MERYFCLWLSLSLTLFVSISNVNGEKVKDPIKPKSMAETVVESPRDGRGGYYPHGQSQEYHYNSYPSLGGLGGFGGFPFDMTTGAIFLFLIFGAMCYPFFSGGGYGGGYARKNSGNDGTPDSWSSSRSINLANLSGTSEKVLSAIEKVYTAYNKAQ